jgi:hypothetical protein
VILISAHDEHDFAAADEVSAVTDSAVPQWERPCRQALLLRNRPAVNGPDTSEEHLEAATALTA